MPDQTARIVDGAEGSQTLERGLAVLEAVAGAPKPMTAAQVVAVTGLHRSVTHRLLVSLQRTGFVVRDSGGCFRSGPTLHGLVEVTRPSLRELAVPVLHALGAELDATATLVEAIGGAAVATVVAEPPGDGPRFSYRVGNRDPLDRGAGGLAALASGPPTAGEAPRVAEVRARGWVRTDSELNAGAYGVAAPITSVPGVRAAVTIVTHRADVADAAVEPVRRAAAALTDATRR
ncbi:UNVERIFIED_CONTAM: hypothetical protein LK11_06325 [Mumia flava]